MCDDNPRSAAIAASHEGSAFARLSIISQEYSLLQIVKLHDSAVVAGKVTLGIDFILKYGGWSDPVGSRLRDLARPLEDFAKQLRSVRNQSLSHNDLAAVLSNTTLGAFNKNDDVAYFEALQEFVDAVHEEVIGGPWPFSDIVLNDVAAFLARIGT